MRYFFGYAFGIATAVCTGSAIYAFGYGYVTGAAVVGGMAVMFLFTSISALINKE